MKEQTSVDNTKGQIILYKNKLEVRLCEDTVWLTQKQMSELFDTERSVITKHLRNIFNSGELEEKSNVQKMHIAHSDKPVAFYNLDLIISVGYRVNSIRGTQFRIWATNVLRKHLVDGYTINEKRLKAQQDKINELQNAVRLLFLCVLRDLRKVFASNRERSSLTFGIDGQISNWAIKDYQVGKPVTEETELFYIDTGTPLMRKEGVEQLNPELFLRSTPSFLVWLIRLFFLEEVMNRYYDFRKVTIDLITNFYKEQRPEYIPMLIAAANSFFANEGAPFGIAPITEKEIVSYYKEDAMIWRVYLAFRKIDRFLHLKILRKPYVYILPGKIKR
ncbi:MAG: DUF6206 family protein [Deltaproteobacteria bacterium]|nr:DUF6206 family protein [Deltaproteobacteria bacterium]